MARNALLGPSWSFVTSVPKPEDEHDFKGLQARIGRTLDLLEGLDESAIGEMDGSLEGKVEFWPSGEFVIRHVLVLGVLSTVRTVMCWK